ncbi:MAG: NAD(P)H-dependent oxidoreductase subunit E [Fusobacteriota bacterium]
MKQKFQGGGKMKLLINELNEIQEKEGYISEDSMLKISKNYDIPKAEVYGIVSFYSRLYTEPTPKYIIRVCKSVSCGINGSQKIRDTIKSYLERGVEPSEDLFALEEVECLGHCGQGPVITINDKVYGDMTEKKILDVLDSYKEGSIK